VSGRLVGLGSLVVRAPPRRAATAFSFDWTNRQCGFVEEKRGDYRVSGCLVGLGCSVVACRAAPPTAFSFDWTHLQCGFVEENGMSAGALSYSVPWLSRVHQ
jgi:hypothetical protein